MTSKEIQTILFSLCDVKFKVFHSSLVPTEDKDKIIGVRTPHIKAFAAKLYNSGEYSEFINTLPHCYYDENALHAQILNLFTDFDECMFRVEKFLPYIDNWAVCDSLSPKSFKKNPEKTAKKAVEWLGSDSTYTVRFGILTLMKLKPPFNFAPEHMELVAAVRSDEYYIKMMQAWYFSEALVKKYSDAIGFITEHKLDKWTHNRAIQKARESFRISEETKEYLNTLKIK